MNFLNAKSITKVSTLPIETLIPGIKIFPELYLARVEWSGTPVNRWVPLVNAFPEELNYSGFNIELVDPSNYIILLDSSNVANKNGSRTVGAYPAYSTILWQFASTGEQSSYTTQLENTSDSLWGMLSEYALGVNASTEVFPMVDSAIFYNMAEVRFEECIFILKAENNGETLALNYSAIRGLVANSAVGNAPGINENYSRIDDEYLLRFFGGFSASAAIMREQFGTPTGIGGLSPLYFNGGFVYDGKQFPSIGTELVITANAILPSQKPDDLTNFSKYIYGVQYGAIATSRARNISDKFKGIISIISVSDRNEIRRIFNEALNYDEIVNLESAEVSEPEDAPPYTPGVGGGVESSTGGGGGNFGVVNGTPETSDPIAPSLPPTGSFEGSVANAGLFVHYAMNANMLEIVGDWLWATDLGLIIAKEVLSILYGSPIESAISLMSYPFNVTALPGVVSNQQELFWGAHGAGFNATAITNPYATIDWGTIQLTEFWGNFLDYAPHTKLELYLPWCTGFVPIDPNECLPGTLRVVTNIELAKGTCLHNVIGNDGRVIATHAGTCGKQLPLTALDTSGKALQLVSTAAAAISAGGSGIAGDAAAGAAESHYRATHQLPLFSQKAMDRYHAGIDAAKAAASAPHRAAGRRAENRALAWSSAVARTPASVQRSGSFSGASAGLGVQYPYLILSRPTQSVPAQYGHHYGYPSNIYTSLSSLRGYTEVGEIHLTGFVCTEEELEEIDSILKGGVIL